VVSEDGPTAYFVAGRESNVDIDEVMQAFDSSGQLLGYVITVTDHEGYGGDIQFSMGVTLDGTLNGISLLSISETAGLGMKAGDVLVPQFANKKVESFTYTKSGSTSDSEIDAISGATSTTKAVVNGVNSGLLFFNDVLAGTEGGVINE
ncbi:MAG: FMN-binding protein, partial [Lachnospiraceae bacterium]|nr:FMN-binding protein [Lachnospiraceae bacterium]